MILVSLHASQNIRFLQFTSTTGQVMDFAQLSTERPSVSDQDPEEVLHRIFGYETFRPLQGDIIREVVNGGDAWS